MKNICKYLSLKNLWILIFLLFFISVPLNLFPEGLFAAGIFWAFAMLMVTKFNIKRFSLFIFVLAFAIRLFIIFTVPTPPASDFKVLFDASQKMMVGDNSYLESSYFQYWAYQLGFVFFQSIFLRIWNNIIILKLLNCLIGAATCFLVYKIADELTEKKSSQCVSLVYCFLPFTLFYPTILSNQFISSFLVYLGIYIIVSKKLQWNIYIKYLAFGALLALANVMRPESIIPLFSTVLFLLITIKKDNFKTNIVNIAILLVAYYGLFNIINYLFIVTNVSPLGLTNNDPLWKFVLGFNHETGGQYSNNDLQYLETMTEMELIKSRLFVPFDQLKELFINKIKNFWCGSGVEWSLSAFSQSGLPFLGLNLRVSDDIVFANALSKWTMVISYLLLITGSIKCLNDKKCNPHMLLIINQIFVTFGVYLLIEVQPRYLYHVQISVLIAASLGVGVVCDMVKRLIDSYKFNKNQTN